MEATPIEFCNTIGFILKNNKDKSNILSEIQTKYNINPIDSETITFSESQNHSDIINRFPYIGSLITRGNKFLMYFTRIYGENTVIMIDRKIKKEDKIQFPKIISICLPVLDIYFNGSLFEIETLLENNKWTIVLTDVFANNGNSCKEMPIGFRINQLYSFLGNLELDPYLHPFKVKVKEFYEINELKNLKIENGVYFHPQNGKHKTIQFNFNSNGTWKDRNQLLELIDYDINKGLEKQLEELNKTIVSSSITLTNDLKNDFETREIIGQVELTPRYGLYKVSLLKEKELVEIGTIRFKSLENKEEFSKLIEKYKTIRLILNYDCEFKKWIPKQLADKRPFSTINDIKDILDFERTSSSDN